MFNILINRIFVQNKLKNKEQFLLLIYILEFIYILKNLTYC